MNLFMAIYEEHRQRTGHQCEKRDDPRVWMCTVCDALIAEKREMDKAEQDAYSDPANAKAETSERNEV